MSEDQSAGYDDTVRVTLRAGVVHRHRLPNYLVLNHEWGKKPRLLWIEPLSAIARVQEALARHTAFKAIAKAAKLSERQARAALKQLEMRGLVHARKNDCWSQR